MKWVLVVILLSASVCLADPPAGYPLVVSGSWVTAAGVVPRVYVWSDDAAGWSCSSLTDGSVLVLGPGGVVSDSLLGISGDWSVSVLGSEVGNGSSRFVPESVDFGDTWYAPKIGWLWTYGFACGCLLHFSSVGVIWLWRCLGYGMGQIWT